MWDAGSGTELNSLSGHAQNITSLAWAGDGLRLATSSFDNSVRIWNVKDGREADRYDGTSTGMTIVAWSPGDRLIVGGARSGVVRACDTRLRANRHFMIDAAKIPFSVIWSPDGTCFAGLSADGILRTWDAETGVISRASELLFDSFHLDGLSTIEWVGNGAVLFAKSGAIGSDTQRAVWWDVSRDHVISSFDSGIGTVRESVPSANHERVAVVYKDPACRPEVWDLRTNATHLLPTSTEMVRQICISPGGSFVGTVCSDKMVHVYNVAEKREAFSVDMSQYQQAPCQVTWSPNEHYLFVNTFDRHAVICEASSGLKLHELAGLPNPPTWSPDEKFFVDGEGRGYVRIWQTAEGMRENHIRINDSGLPSSVGWAPPGDRLIASHTINFSEGSRVIVRDVSLNVQQFSLSGVASGAGPRNWTVSGDRLVTPLKDGSFRIWNGLDGQSCWTSRSKIRKNVDGSGLPTGTSSRPSATMGSRCWTGDRSRPDDFCLLAVQRDNYGLPPRLTTKRPEGLTTRAQTRSLGNVSKFRGLKGSGSPTDLHLRAP